MFQAIFFPHSNLSEVCHVSYWREFSRGTFQLIFRWLLPFCANLSVSDCQHGIGCDGAFVYCWMSCLRLKNIDQLLPLLPLLPQLLCFLRFVVYSIVRWSYTARTSFNLGRHNFLRRASFFFFCSLPLLLHNLHFSALDNPLHSPLLGRPIMIKMMSQTSIQHSLLPYVDEFSIISLRDLWRPPTIF